MVFEFFGLGMFFLISVGVYYFILGLLSDEFTGYLDTQLGLV